MLNVLVGQYNLYDRVRYYVGDIDITFNSHFEESWADYWASYIIEKIDKSELISKNQISSPWLGVVPIEKISGGAKQLIMMKHVPSIIYDGDNFGDNCWNDLLLLSKYYELCITLSYYPRFEWCEGAQIRFINNNKIASNFNEYIDIHLELNSEDTHIFKEGEINWPVILDDSSLVDEIDF